MSGAPSIEIIPIDRVEIAFAPWRWEFAVSRRDEIDRHFAGLQRRLPALWNGRVLLLHRYAIGGGVLRGACFETDYAGFLAWRDWGFPDASVFNIFASAALQAADGAHLVGEMAQSTAGAGQLVFPGGTPDREDVAPDGTLDLAASVSRELMEETGLDIAAFAAKPGWVLLRDRGYFALMKPLIALQDAHELRARILRHLANEAEPEFTDIRIVRGPADVDPAMLRFLVAYLENIWRQ